MISKPYLILDLETTTSKLLIDYRKNIFSQINKKASIPVNLELEDIKKLNTEVYLFSFFYYHYEPKSYHLRNLKKYPVHLTKVETNKLNDLWFTSTKESIIGDFLENIDVNTDIFLVNSSHFDNYFLVELFIRLGYELVPINILDILKDGVISKDYVDYISDIGAQNFIKDTYKNRLEQMIKLYKHHKKIEPLIKAENKPELIKILTSKKYWNKLNKYEFSVKLGSSTKIMEVHLKNKRGKTLIFRDLNLLFKGSLASKGATLNTYYKIICDERHSNCYCKLDNENDYSITTTFPTIQSLLACGNEYEYVKRDVLIPAYYIEMINQFFPREKWKITSSSTAFNNLKELFIESIIKQLVIKKAIELQGDKWIFTKKGTYLKSLLRIGTNKMEYWKLISSIFNFYFPVKWLYDSYYNTNHIKTQVQIKYTNYDEYKRRFFQGGICLINPKFQKKHLKHCYSLDINTLYSSIEILEKHVISPYDDGEIRAPYSNPIRKEFWKLKNPDWLWNKFYVVKLIITETLVTDALPFLPSKNIDGTNKWNRTLYAGDIFYVDTYTLFNFKKYYYSERFYDMKPKYYQIEYMFIFKTMRLASVFKPFVNYWGKLKIQAVKNKDVALKKVAKEILHGGGFGMWALKYVRESSYYDYKGSKKWNSFFYITKCSKYLPIGVLITSLARLYMVDKIGFDWNKHCYEIDTDGITCDRYLFDKLKNDTNDLEFGKFKVENCDFEAIFIKPKRYVNIFDNYIKIVASGYEISEGTILYLEKLKKYIRFNSKTFKLKWINQGFYVLGKESILNNDGKPIIYNKFKYFDPFLLKKS